MDKSGIVLITGNFLFPTGNAAGKRVLGLGYIFRDLGYEVVFAGCNPNRRGDKIIDTKDSFEEFLFFEFNGARSIKNILNVRGAFDEFLSVIKEINENTISLVVLYGSPVVADWIRKVTKYCKRKKIPVVFDCVDWIEKSGFESILKNGIKFIDTNYMKRFLACKCNGIVTVSRYLYDYFRERGCKAVIIPPVGKYKYDIDSGENKTNNYGMIKNTDTQLNFVYAGAIPRGIGINRTELKDRIDLTLELMYRLFIQGKSFVFDIYGIEKEQYVKAIPEQSDMIEQMSGVVTFHGRVSNDLVCQRIKEADFTILNRIVTKVTTAGFPSKVSESLLMGTPVITNDTSNIKEYVKDHENGIIISFDLDMAEKQIAELYDNKTMIKAMKQNCRKVCCFDYQNYSDKLRAFVEDISS